MQGTNPTEFEKWYSKKSGYSIEFLIASRKRTPIGTYYQQESIQSRYEAFMAGRVSALMPLPPMPEGE
ncbi:hypothetical protein ABN256_17275 [Proteus sp. fly-1008]|uniref:hypothetical protein n=2 Tax=Proteus TaxID=583 RepID=UPI000DF9940F|nr:hypothetical protein [Proteus penneri]SUB99926.1 Uncharacterised protein [Proteus penneri]